MKYITGFLVTLLSAQLFAADVIYLKNGDVYRGEIIEQKINSHVQIRLIDQNEKRIDWSMVDRISKEELKLSERDKLLISNAPKQDEKDSARRVGKTIFLATYGATLGYTLGKGGTATSLIPVIGPIVGDQSKFTQSEKTLATVSALLQAIGVIIWVSNSDNTPKNVQSFNFTPMFNGSELTSILSFNF